ncbi:MAG: epoxide hydrolase [Bacteroidota bacterium]|nr:epoxide hydrolase [Bacteroidota bacterium]
MIKPFLANAHQHNLDDLMYRIRNTRWTDELANSSWTYGSNLSYMKELANYWSNYFDWRKTESEINSYPNFTTVIDGFTIHFLYIKGKGRKPVPLIITHGWPGSFLEMMKIIPLLTEGPEFSFDLVIPSLIGFGYSDPAIDAGCNSAIIADLWNKLMNRLGYTKYGAQGGDIGAGVGTWLALKYPEAIAGLHLNFISGSYKPFFKPGEQPATEYLEFQRFVNTWSDQEGAYAHIHATKPITLAYGLNDSPIGLCAWMLEKFYNWSDHQGHIENSFTKDELLSNITLYWLTRSIHSSIRIYNENSKIPLLFKENDFVKPPVGFAKFPKELPTPPRVYIEKGFNIQHWTEMPAGGHFAAMEQPELLAKDITEFFKKV